MAEEWTATPAEQRAANVGGAVLAIGSFAGIVLGNLTGVWWPLWVESGLVVTTAAAFTAWGARTRNQGFVVTAGQILRSGRTSSS